MLNHYSNLCMLFIGIACPSDAKMRAGVTQKQVNEGGCCYNYYNEHKCPCLQDGGWPKESCTKENSKTSTWIPEGEHGINCKPGADNPTEDSELGPASYWTRAKEEHGLEEPCKDEPFCQDFKTSSGSCYDASGDPSSGHAVVCNVDEATCTGVQDRGTKWFPPGYAMADRNGVPTCCHCNAGCDHSKENPELDCIHSVGYRDVTTKECNRKDGVKDEDNPNHDDLSDLTIGRKKCPIPQGISPDAGVIRPKPTTSGAGAGGGASKGTCMTTAKAQEYGVCTDAKKDWHCYNADGKHKVECDAECPGGCSSGAGAGAGGGTSKGTCMTTAKAQEYGVCTDATKDWHCYNADGKHKVECDTECPGGCSASGSAGSDSATSTTGSGSAGSGPTTTEGPLKTASVSVHALPGTGFFVGFLVWVYMETLHR